jgi:hypothetical protein
LNWSTPIRDSGADRPSSSVRWLTLASALTLGLLSGGLARAQAAEAPQIALVTFGPGQLYWERFGHNGIIVRDSATGQSTVYNYGVFDFEDREFVVNFVRGDIQYQISAESLDDDVAMYAAEGRSITVQVLNLMPAQARSLATFLAWNARPENARYRYDYFLNNCSTKVRDALNSALGGLLERELTRKTTAHTYRFDAVRLISPDFWLGLGMDAGLGPKADRPLSLWQESFVPMELSRAIRDVMVVDARGSVRPLVKDEEIVLPGKLLSAPAAPPPLAIPFLITGLALAALLLWLGRKSTQFLRVSFAVLTCAWWLACGLSGLVLATLWWLTDHWVTRGNENLLLLDPLCLLLPLLSWTVPRAARWLTMLVAVIALTTPLLRAVRGLHEENLSLIALCLPVHLSLALLAWREALVRGGCRVGRCAPALRAVRASGPLPSEGRDILRPRAARVFRKIARPAAQVTRKSP